jgi:alpha-ketoglutarate-dependent taurine dioxygenase
MTDVVHEIGCLSPAQRDLLEVLLKEEGIDLSSSLILPRSRETNCFPLSFAQQRIWYLDQLEPGSFAYNMHVPVRLKGRLEVGALRQTLNEIVCRHEILRTVFSLVDDRPVQIITPGKPIILPVLDLRHFASGEREGQVRKLVLEEAQRPFDLAHGPLLRATLLQLDDEEHVALFTMHHITTDGWSMGVLIREVAELYEAFSQEKPSPLADLPIQYADFALWQRERMRGEVLEPHLAYWRQQLAHLPVLTLRIAHPRPSVQTSRGGMHHFTLSRTLSESLKELTRRRNVTLFMTLLAAFQVLLHYHSGQDDIVVGTDVANRSRAETEHLIGFFVNQLVLRTNLAGDPGFSELLGRVREVALGAYAHQDLPFDKLVEELNPERDARGHPLCQIKIILQNTPTPAIELPGLTLSSVNINHEAAHTDLTLYLIDTEQGLTGSAEYSTDMFTAEAIGGLARDFETLLGEIVKSPDMRLQRLVETMAQSARKKQLSENRERLSANLKTFISTKPKPIRLTEEKLIETDYFRHGAKLPLLSRPVSNDIDAVALVQRTRKNIERDLLKHGGILFRNFKVESIFDFLEFAKAFSWELLDYCEGSTPRSVVHDKVYTSTEYPAHQYIPLHNETSYSRSWPTKIWFYCVEPARLGGETPIADSRLVFQLIDPTVKRRFTEKKVMYVRNYANGLDLPWQKAFLTTSRSAVEDYCRKAAIEFEWSEGDRLRTRQVCQAVAAHPQTGEMVWFNQAHLFHVSNLGPAVAESLLSMVGQEDLPRNAYYGDGSPIENSALDLIREAYQQATVTFPWQQGDILMLDNMLIAHGRMPFEGPRKVVVAMADTYTNPDPQLDQVA